MLKKSLWIPEWTVDITPAWQITPNPSNGPGLALMTQRGIPCEFHVQIVTEHCGNMLSKASVEEVISKNKTNYIKLIDDFISYSKSLRVVGASWDECNRLGLSTYSYILKHIIQCAEDTEFRNR